MLEPGVPARLVAGRVTVSGTPAKGAKVLLRGGRFSGTTIPDDVRVTDENGRFDFGARGATSYSLSASLEGYAPAILVFNLADPMLAPPPSDLELRLEPCAGTLVGRIRDTSGGHVVGASVRVAQLVGVESGPDGGYELCLGPGEHEVRVDASGYGSALLRVRASGEDRQDFVLVPEATIEGLTRRATDKASVGGTRIVAIPLETGAAVGVTVSASDGSFHLDGLMPGRYRLWAAAPGLSLVASVFVTLTAGQASTGTVVELTEVTTVAGTVVRRGQPIVGAVVRINGVSGRSFSQAATSQADGTFVIPNVVPGAVSVVVQSYRVERPLALEIPPDGSRTLVVEVADLASIRGRVLRHGKPVAHAMVRSAQAVTTSQEDGAYRLVGLDGGEIKLVAIAEAEGAFAEKTLTLSGGEERAGVDLDLAGGAGITGTVVDQSARPVVGATVVWTQLKTGDEGRCRTDSRGAFRCNLMTGGGDYRPRVFASDRATLPLPAELDGLADVHLENGDALANGVRLRVRDDRTSIEGIVVDGNGAAVADARVAARSTASSTPYATTRTTEDGRFAVNDLPAGSYSLQATAESGEEGRLEDVPAGTKGVRIPLARSGAMQGSLKGFTVARVPIKGLGVPTSGRYFLAEADTSGFRVNDLPAGRYVVSAQTPRGGDAKLVDVRAGETAHVVLESHGTGTLEVRVSEFGTGAPLRGVRCQTLLRAGDYSSIPSALPAGAGPVTDASGQFLDPAAPAGDISVVCASNGNTSVAQGIGTLPRDGRLRLALQAVRLREGSAAGTIGIELDPGGAASIISNVVPGSPAARSGVRVGDRVLSIDGVSVEALGPSSTAALVSNLEIGTSVLLEIAGREGSRSVKVPVIAR